MMAGRRSLGHHLTVSTFLVIPLLCLIVAIPFAWGWGLGWTDVGLIAGWYVLTGLGITVGYHRHFTHGSFKANRPLRIALAVAGTMAAQGPVIGWVADHRRHHAFSDRAGDPHSPWRYGTSPAAVARGFWHAHMGWLFGRELTNAERFAPDLLADRDVSAVNRATPGLILASLISPALLGGALTWSLAGMLSGFFWAGLVRIALLHHVTWSVNSICHMIGERPFASRDRATNFWPLALFSFGEAWHNAHHADPTCARHGVLRSQIDISARFIWLFERCGWVRDVRWPTARRLARLAAR